MQTFTYDAFISYPDIGLSRVRPFIKALEDAGLTIFWDKTIPPGQDWMDLLEQKIASSRYTIVCVSSAALRSKFMLAELQVSAGKIIPVFLEATDLPLIWEARIGHLQRANLVSTQFNPADPAFAQLCAIVAGRTVVEQRLEETIEERARQLIENSSASDLSLVIALAILGGAATDAISMFAADFERRYSAMQHRDPEEKPRPLESLRNRLRRLHAEIFDRTDHRFGVKRECARFVEPALGHTVLALAWSEYEQLRVPILNWIDEWAAESPLWIRLRLALNLGILAQDERRLARACLTRCR